MCGIYKNGTIFEIAELYTSDNKVIQSSKQIYPNSTSKRI